jgi:hypothetical protein
MKVDVNRTEANSCASSRYIALKRAKSSMEISRVSAGVVHTLIHGMTPAG